MVSFTPRPTRTELKLLRYVLVMVVLAMTFAIGAKCYKPDTRVVVFIQGLYTSYDAAGTQTSPIEEHRFAALKAGFVAAGYEEADLLDFSYAGGRVSREGVWQPLPYACEQTDHPAAAHLARLEAMLRDYKDAHPDAHFTLVGHSLGGYLAFLEGAAEAARDEGDKLDIDVVVTLDAPLKGASADKKTIIDLAACEKTYEAGTELAGLRTNPGTAELRRQQAAAMAAAGVRAGTFGNLNDCLFRTARCVGGDWVDDGDTMFLEGQAAVSRSYEIVSNPLDSHEAILIHPPAIADVVAFVGAP